MNNSLPLTDNQKAFIANAIYRAVTLDMPEMIAEHQLPTTVGSGLFRWNFINRNLSDAFEADFETFIKPRGAWKLLLLRDKKSNLSFSIMTESNLRKLQRNFSEHIHYLEALVSKNKARKAIEGQFCIPDFERQRDVTILATLRDELLSSFSGIVEEHVLILFDYTYTGVISARAVLLNPNMEIAFSENWTKYLQATFVPKQSILNTLAADDEIMVRLKPQYESNTDIVVTPVNTSGDMNDE